MNKPISNSMEDTRWTRLYAAKMEIQVTAAFELFRRHAIEPVLIKGWAAARNYPPDRPRFYSDIDLAVSDADFRQAMELTYTSKGRSLSIDLHKELRHLDKVPWKEIMDASEIVDLNGVGIRIPSPEDHLRVLCVHWLNDGGERKERLWDIYHAVENRPSDFDWDRCLNSTGPNRRYWVICAIMLTHSHLGLQIDGLPDEIMSFRVPAWVNKTVEKRWARDVPASRSLAASMDNPGSFYRRMQNRIPPNPIQATIESDGDLIHGSRFLYQFNSMRRRALPSMHGIWSKLSRRN